MHVDQEGIDLITVFEQFRASPYPDAKGVWTAGWGTALTDSAGRQIKERALVNSAMIRIFGASSATKASADKVFAAMLESFELDVSADCATPTQSEFNAMVSFAYNCGAGGFRGSHVRSFHNAQNRSVADLDLATLARDARANVFADDAKITTMARAFAAWSRSGGVYELGLFRRRMAEAMVYGGDTTVAHAYAAVEAFRG